MPKFFAHADAMLVSLKDIPIFALTVPYKTQCYMACGKPIVASLNGEGARIVRESGAGVAVAAGQPQALAEAIAALIDAGPDRLASYAANARRYFDENYAAAKIYSDLEDGLRQAAALLK
jgi:glycosyltransferase involved in cell wall biosynthesis